MTTTRGNKGRMMRVASVCFAPRRYEVECGAHGCVAIARVGGDTHARSLGWYRDTKDGYGWICPKCQEGDPLPKDQS